MLTAWRHLQGMLSSSPHLWRSRRRHVPAACTSIHAVVCCAHGARACDTAMRHSRRDPSSPCAVQSVSPHTLHWRLPPNSSATHGHARLQHEVSPGCHRHHLLQLDVGLSPNCQQHCPPAAACAAGVAKPSTSAAAWRRRCHQAVNNIALQQQHALHGVVNIKQLQHGGGGVAKLSTTLPSSSSMCCSCRQAVNIICCMEEEVSPGCQQHCPPAATCSAWSCQHQTAAAWRRRCHHAVNNTAFQ